VGSTYFFESFLSKKLENTVSIQEKLAEFGDPQVELYLLRSCLGVCKITHILHCVPSSLLGAFHLYLTLPYVTALVELCSISDNAWSQAPLPFCMSGLGLWKSQCCSHPAFLGSCNSARILVSHLICHFILSG